MQMKEMSDPESQLSAVLQRLSDARSSDDSPPSDPTSKQTCRVSWDDAEAAHECHGPCTRDSVAFWRAVAAQNDAISFAVVARALGALMKDADDQEAAWPAAALYSALLNLPGSPVRPHACIPFACKCCHAPPPPQKNNATPPVSPTDGEPL
jgi:hypothetical protein